MKELIEVFRMNEVQAKTRAKLIIEMGKIINMQMGSNLTEALVYELVKEIDPENEILKDKWYQHKAGLITIEEYFSKSN